MTRLAMLSLPLLFAPDFGAGPAAQTAGAYAPGPNRVTFEVDDQAVVGTLFLPDGYEPGDRPPAVVVDGPWTQVKEQVGTRYGEALSARGVAALAIDHRGWGESEGIRHYESAALKVEDLRAAVGFLHEAGLASGVGLLGVCAGAGVAAEAAAQDDRVGAFATVAAWLQHPTTTPTFYGGEEGVAARVRLALEARRAYERTGEVATVAAYDPSEGSDAAMFFPVDYYGNAERGAVPAWENRFAVMGWAEWLAADAVRHASEIDVPTLVVHSDESALPDNARRFHAELAGPKDLVWTQGEHTLFYDAEPQVSVAVDAVAEHFRSALR